ncbi:MAG: AMP-binding protein [Bacteroidota bacterium]
METRTLIEFFYEKEKNTPDKPFLRQPFGKHWEVYTYAEAGQMARKLATGLNSLGLEPKSHIGLISKNCREWIIADLAIMMAGHVSVPFFPTLTGEQLSQVIEIGDVKALFVGKLETWDEMKSGVPEGLPIIAFPHYEGNSKVEMGESWQDFMNRHEPLQGDPKPNLDDLWTIIFTSGTTGTPKGVMHPYKSATSLLDSTKVNNPFRLDFNGDNEFFSFLPLNHIAERTIVESACIVFGGQISFSESLATFPQNLRDTQPTLFFAVPRIWTKFQLGVLDKMPQKKLDLYLKIPFLSSMVKNKIKKSLGMERTRTRISGAAAISKPLKEWYKKMGIPITEGYGMTENTAACSCLLDIEHRPGSVGKPQTGVELKIDESNGELLMKAPWVMTGYYKSPEKTAETLKDGWLHTGDQGRIDEEGYLYLTGRVKDTFKTAKGEFIVPEPIEFKFSTNLDIEQICLLGLGLEQPLAVIVPSELGQKKSREELKDSLASTLQNVNSELASYQRVSTIVISREPFSVENGLLTPTLKVKRSVLNTRYQEHCLAWQNDKEDVIWQE